MTPAQITAEVEASFQDWSGRAVPVLADMVPLAIRDGIDGDADFAFIATIIDGRVRCGLVCGCTLLVGARMRWSLTAYYNGDAFRSEAALQLFSDHAVEDLQDGDTCIGVLRGEDECWRSFRGEWLPSFDEVRAYARRTWN